MANKIYVGTYHKYNSGSIAGKWFDLDDYSDAESLTEEIREFHSDEEDPELMIQDTDLEYKICDLDESYSEAEIQEYYDRLDAIELSHLDIDVVAAWLENGMEFDIEEIEDAYSGKFDSDKDFAENMAEELGYFDKNISWPHTCIDWKRAARELMYDYFEVNGHYFRNC